MDHPILLFDGFCNLCTQSVLAVIKRDPQAIFRFASLQSEQGKSLLRKHALDTDGINSVILVWEEAYLHKSEAVLKVFELLGGYYSWMLIFRWLPTRFLDWIYDLIADNRYRWFGKKEACMIPSPELRERFLS